MPDHRFADPDSPAPPWAGGGLGALRLAAGNGDEGAARALALSQDPGAARAAGAALIECCAGGFEPCARMLLPVADLGAELPCKDGRGALWWAIHRGWEDFALLAAPMMGERANAKDWWGETVLMHAAKAGMARLCAFLARSAPPGERDADGYTALMWACMGGRVECVRTLASREAARAREKGGRCALELAADCGADECCVALAGWAGPESLERAAKSKWIKEGTRAELVRAALAWRESKELLADAAAWGEPPASERRAL